MSCWVNLWDLCELSATCCRCFVLDKERNYVSKLSTCHGTVATHWVFFVQAPGFAWGAQLEEQTSHASKKRMGTPWLTDICTCLLPGACTRLASEQKEALDA